jgi:hypothetical protein
MPERSNEKRPRDLNQLAYQVMLESTAQAPKFNPEAGKPVDPAKNLHAVALGRLGGLKGGIARAAKLGPRKRSQIAAKAAKARWSKKPMTFLDHIGEPVLIFRRGDTEPRKFTLAGAEFGGLWVESQEFSNYLLKSVSTLASPKKTLAFVPFSEIVVAILSEERTAPN